MKALVMGGGMCGLATAINLLDLGLEVELVEADEIFGGRASSWTDEDGDMIDNALHVFMPYYVNLLGFFEKLGIDGKIIWKDSEFYYAQPGGKTAVLKFARLPAPFHAVYAILHLLKDFDEVSTLKFLTYGIPMGAGILKYADRLEEADMISMESFLGRYASLEVWRPLMEPAICGLTFTPLHQVSARVMLNWFMKMFCSSANSRIGFADGGLGEIWVDSCLSYIREKGGVAGLGKAVTSINVEDSDVTGVVINGSETVEADIYVSAMSPYSLRRVLPEESFSLPYFRDLWYFQLAPSLSLQVWFDRKVTEVDVTFFSNDTIFNTYADLSNVLPGVFPGGSMFEMVLSPADSIRDLPDELIFKIAIGQIRNIFPTARDAEVKKWKVIRQRQGVYRPYPGMEQHRPFQRSPYGNFYVTGDFTRTPVSSGGMEAAIWNANKVAELVATDSLGEEISLNVDYLPYERLMKTIKVLKPLQTGLLALGAAAALHKILKRRSQ